VLSLIKNTSRAQKKTKNHISSLNALGFMELCNFCSPIYFRGNNYAYEKYESDTIEITPMCKVLFYQKKGNLKELEEKKQNKKNYHLTYKSWPLLLTSHGRIYIIGESHRATQLKKNI